MIARLLSIPVKYVTIKPGKDTAGHVKLAKLTKYHSSPENNALLTFAGPLAQTEFTGDKLRIDGSDRTGIWHDTRRAVREPTIDRRLFLIDTRKQKALRTKLKSTAVALVWQHKEAIGRVAEALIECETLSGKQIDEIIARRRWRKSH